MRFSRYLIPLIVFLISTATGFYSYSYQRNIIREEIKYAGENGLPIVCFISIDNYSNQIYYQRYYSLNLVVPGHDPVYITDLEIGFDYGEMIFFTEDGTLHLRPIYFHSGTITEQILRFPDTEFKDGPEYDATAHLLSSEGLKARKVLPETLEIASLYDDRVEVQDVVTGEFEVVQFTENIEWPEKEGYYQHYLIKISGDGSLMYIAYVSNPPSEVSSVIYRCEMESGEISEIINMDSAIIDISTNYSGDSFAVSRLRPDLTTGAFFSVFEVGEEVFQHDIQGVGTNGFSQYSDNWIVIRSVNAPIWETLIVNLDDPSVQYRYTHVMPRYSGDWSGFVAIYEPPPEGLDGMYDNYDPD